MLLWLTDRSPAATQFATAYLLAQSGTGNDINGKPKAFTRSGLQSVYAGADAAQYFHAPVGDPRVRDFIGVVRHGVVYTGGQGKIAEHGGAAPDDRDVPLMVTGDPHQVVDSGVETTQIAPTILSLPHLDPAAPQTVRIEHTTVLPAGEG